MVRNINSFEDLEVWKLCRKLKNVVTQLARELLGDERFRLTDQIIRSARSVTNNIAEGYGRYHYKENIQFCRQSRGSLYELIDHLICCFDEGFIDAETLDRYREECMQCIRMLNGYLRFLNSHKGDIK